MAEPLLKRTFSRLRSRRKTDPKVNDVPVQTSSPPSSPVGPEPPSPPRNHITVAKKQQWARQGAAAPPTYLCMSSSHRPHNKEVPAVTTHDVHGNTRRQSPRQDQVDSCSDRTVTCLSWDRSSAPCVVAASTTLQDTSQPAGGSTDVSASNTGKRSGQRSYLQSLERSSRAWVLSSGKTQVSEDQVCPLEDTGGNIWYNPIPEEEDSSMASSSTTVTTTATLHREVEDEIWRRRIDPEDTTSITEGAGNSRAESGGPWLRSAEVRGNICPPEGANPNVRHQVDDITTESAEPTSLDSSPVTQKKASVSASVMDRLRSPGTVRKLSMKMKKLPELRRKLSLRSSRSQRQGSESRGGGDEWANKSVTSSSNQNVISKYHLDSSAPPARPLRRSSRGRSAGRGGHLSDGDSPELLPRQQAPPSPPQPMSSQELGCDTSSFRLYLGSEPQRCSQRVSGLLTIHLLGLEEMKSCRVDDSKEVFLAIQVDGVTRARTSLLNLRSCALPLNHTFHLELERARKLRIVVLTPANAHTVGGSKATGQSDRSDGPTRNRVCCLGGVSIPPLFKGSRSQQLCVKLEPQGLLYVKLSLQEKWETQNNDSSIPANVFGVELHHLVEKEGSAVPIPLLIQKAVAEIEQRGLKVVGLYRLCGSAAVKKELRDWFERNSSAVCLSEDLYPDINVITGILKDYLRELPSPLITTNLYQVVRDAMTLHPLTADPQRTVELLSCLPPPERATLSLLLDHLSLVASFSSFNRMTQQNLAVCFGPVLLTPTQEAWQHGMGGVRGGRGGNKGLAHNQEMASAVDFKRHIEALHYLLQQWPVPKRQFSEEEQASPPPSPLITHNAVQRTQLPSLHLSLPQSEETVVSRRGRSGLGRLDSPPPINRYAGDWSVCGQDILSGQEADYDEVAGSESDEDSDEEEEPKKEVWPPGGSTALYVEDFLDFDAPFNCRLSLKDFDNLIHDLDRELAKHINICL